MKEVKECTTVDGVRQPFRMGKCDYISQISLFPNQPASISEISNFTLQYAGLVGPLQPQSVSLLVLLCDCLDLLKSHTKLNEKTN